MERKRKVMIIVVMLLAVLLVVLTVGGIRFKMARVSICGEHISKDATTLTVTGLTGEDVIAMDQLPLLEEINAQGVRDYELLQKLQSRHPGCDVHYTVCLDGQEYPEDTREVTLTALKEEELELFQYLPQLTAVHAEACTDYALLQKLWELHPEYEVFYTLSIGGEEYTSYTTTLEISGITNEDIAMIAYLPSLEKLHMVDPEADPEMLLQMVESRPEVACTWEMEVFGIHVDNTTTQLSFADIAMTGTDTVSGTLAYFPNLQKVDMSGCGFDNETMAAFREEKRDEYKVVWTVQCGKLSVRTDEEFFIPVKNGVYYLKNQEAYNLRYCEDMVCIDLGRMNIKDISFAENMPHLKYLVLSYTSVQDISPLENCRELVLLDLARSGVRDYTPLLNCTALEDLNLGYTFGDETVITQMTWLKNLWWMGRGYNVRVLMEEKLPRAHVEFNGSNVTGNGWLELKNYQDMRNLPDMS